MLRKLAGSALSMLGLGSVMFFVMAVSDLIAGDSGTGAGVLAGLAVFFGGLAATPGFAAWRMLTTSGAAGRDTATQARWPNATTQHATGSGTGTGVDIALEAQVLEQAAKHDGRVTVAEIAVACAVSLDRAERALDELAQRGHADLHITDAGERVYVVKGFLSAAEKEAAKDVVEVTR